MTQPKKLIEVAMPVKEISAESVRDKSIRHGHISTLHLWWARRPLPVCRAVVFASLVPDPLDENCSQAFKDAVKELLGKPFALERGGSEVDWYKPYTDIPYTAAHDLMEDNLRNRLLMFIGKFSDKYVENERKGKPNQPKEQLSDASLIKWESRNNDTIIGIARKLIWVAYNANVIASGAKQSLNCKTLLLDFDKHYSAIKDAERELYSLLDRHLKTKESKQLSANLENAIEAFLNKMPKVFDPFAGGGAIPLEAARLGCRSFGNDINPVAHIIQKGSLEFPQKYGKPITYSKAEFTKMYGEEAFKSLPVEWKKVEAGETKAVRIPNRLSFDVEYYAKKLLKMAEDEIGHLYPSDEKGNKPIAYYWARVGTCSNPSCKAEVPLLKQFYLANTKTKQVYLKPIISGTKIDFKIETGSFDEEGWMARGNLVCPCCGNTTDVKSLKQQFINGLTKERLLAVIWEGASGKIYKQPTLKEILSTEGIASSLDRPTEVMPVQYTQALPSCTWGLSKWGDMFTNRQLIAILTLVKRLKEVYTESNSEYSNVIKTYLGILIDRVAVVNTSFGVWHVGGEKLERIMGRQAIPMVFDFPESNPFCNASGSALNQLEWLTRYVESENEHPFSTLLKNASSGEKNQFQEKYLTAVVTDPPYYDAIAYADLSDFFYVWLKRTLADVYPLNFAFPQTPKGDECTALKHHHSGKLEKAKQHFEDKLLQIFDAIEHQTSDIVSIMFAHQSTEAWTTLCNSILGARMNITGSWANDTEMTGALKTDKAFLSSSVTVACKPVKRKDFADFKTVKSEIEKMVAEKVEELYSLGFRGPDLLTACFGQAVSKFGEYNKVEKSDGSQVEVKELLKLARDSAFNALYKDFPADEFTKFYITWAQFFGFSESDFGEVNNLVKAGLSIETKELFNQYLLEKNGNHQSLAGYSKRIEERPSLGTDASDSIIDLVHRAMLYFKKNDTKSLLQHIAQVANAPDSLFWRVVNSLVEVLPVDKEHDDKKIASELLASKDNLLRDSKQQQQTNTQTTLGL